MINNLKWVLWLVTALYLTQQVFADEFDDQVRKIADQLRCPTCQAQSVKDSEAGLSVNMKMKIRELLEEGKSEAEILNFFEDRYGEWILRSPRMQGFNLLLWGMPAVLILVAVLLLFRSMKARALRLKPDQLTPLSDDEKQKIENDLKEI